MKVALIADVHANFQALQAVVEDARAWAPDVQFWMLGDSLGRGPAPSETWHLLAELIRPTAWVVGNWDWMLLQKLQPLSINGLNIDGISNLSWQSVAWQREVLEATGDWTTIEAKLTSQPIVWSPLGGVYLAHGALLVTPISGRPFLEACVTEYIKPGRDLGRAQDSWRALQAYTTHPTPSLEMCVGPAGWLPPTLMCVGHTHIQHWLRLGTQQEELCPPPLNVWLPLANTPQSPILINPGSVGFARDHNSRCAAYVWLDFSEPPGRARFRRVAYAQAETLRQIDEFYLDAKLRTTLKKELQGPCHAAQ